MLKYLHHSHAHTDSQDDSTVLQKPLLHAVDAPLRGGKEEVVRRNTARRRGKQRRDPGRSRFKTPLLAGRLGPRGEEQHGPGSLRSRRVCQTRRGLEQWIPPRTNTPAPALKWPLCPALCTGWQTHTLSGHTLL